MAQNNNNTKANGSTQPMWVWLGPLESPYLFLVEERVPAPTIQLVVVAIHHQVGPGVGLSHDLYRVAREVLPRIQHQFRLWCIEIVLKGILYKEIMYADVTCT